MSLDTRITRASNAPLQVFDHAYDLIVGLAAGQARGQVAVDGLGLQEQPPGGAFVAVTFQRNALGDVG